MDPKEAPKHDKEIGSGDLCTPDIDINFTKGGSVVDASPNTAGSIPKTTGSISKIPGAIPKTTDSLPKTTGSIPKTTGAIPIMKDVAHKPADAVPKSTGAIPKTSGAVSKTSGASKKKPSVISYKGYIPKKVASPHIDTMVPDTGNHQNFEESIPIIEIESTKIDIPAILEALRLEANNELSTKAKAILKIIVTRFIFDIRPVLLDKIFSPFGTILNLSTYMNNENLNIVIKYEDVKSAAAAKYMYDNRNVFNNCCRLHIQYSTEDALLQKDKTENSQDHTNNQAKSIKKKEYQNETNIEKDNNFQFRPISFADGGDQLKSININISGYGPVNVIIEPVSFPSVDRGDLVFPKIKLSKVLQICNLPPMSQIDDLFTLVGVYSNVRCIKLLYNKPDIALVELMNDNTSYIAKTFLHDLPFHGNMLNVKFSYDNSVVKPLTNRLFSGIFKDYSESTLHRTVINVYPPSAVLYLKNFPEYFTQKKITETFSANQIEIKAVKNYARKSAEVILSSLADAVLALIKMHNFKIDETHYLYVMFSRNSYNNHQ